MDKKDRRLKIYVVGEEKNGWALDTDARLAREALSKFADVVCHPWKANFIHSVSPNSTYQIWRCKQFISLFPGNPHRLFAEEPKLLEFCKKSVCVAQSSEAKTILEGYGVKDVYQIPYIADLHNFYYISDKEKLKKKYNIPENKFIIGNFMRDTQVFDCKTLKPEKGPDIFCDVVSLAMNNIGKDNLLILLAGPRRMWIRNRLQELGIPYQYIGVEKPDGQDDWSENFLKASKINELINICDLIIVSSRSEGGPRVIMEAASSRVPIISTRVGIAQDILEECCIYDNIEQGVRIVEKHYKNNFLGNTIESHYNRVHNNYSVDAVSKMYEELYSKLKEHPVSHLFMITICFRVLKCGMIKRIKSIIGG